MEGGDCVESATLDRLHLSSLRWVKAVAGLHSGQVVSTPQRARCAMVRERQDLRRFVAFGMSGRGFWQWTRCVERRCVE